MLDLGFRRPSADHGWVPNPGGHPKTLVRRHPRNRNREVHGLYSARRSLTEEARRVADTLMQAQHVVQFDRIAAEEIGALIVQLDRVDAALADGRVEHRGR